ncbi:methylenetetrahydrofolate reductase [NAD(P)H] [Candidatus Thioglobus sp.]|uniref:methylenetetrahydrofolate reductase [NAD(P)H] n=1 Tax=Candidatus Thioglobus sp. TaxID=2026721 RepID=UPI003D0EB427
MQLSFEFFPPRTSQGKLNLKKTRQELSAVNPHYFSTTFGAGGTTQDATLETVLDIQANDNIAAAPHLSCIDSEKSKILSLLKQYQAAGINRIVALRGDIPSGVRDIGDFHYANELVEFIRHEFNDHFHIEVAAYPEMHPQAKNMDADIKHFVNKIKAGANSAITQYFYNADAYFRFKDEVQKHGIDIPITPGIMPITNYDQLMRFSNMCGAEIPRWIEKRLSTFGDDSASLNAFGFEVVAQLCDQLKSQGVEDFHFYSMNKSKPSLQLAQGLIE